jgi:hypothetical protein
MTAYVNVATGTVLSATNTWTAQQTFLRQVTVSTSLALSGPFLAGGSSGASGQLLQSQGGAAPPIWISSVTLLGGAPLLRQSLLQSAVAAKNASYPMTDSDFGILGDATSGLITITLPAANSAGRMVFVLKTDNSANHVRIAGAGSDKIQGSATVDLSVQYQKNVLVSDGGTLWYVISQ